jgi:hypothetical protein
VQFSKKEANIALLLLISVRVLVACLIGVIFHLQVPIRGVTSPADLAKQYMSSRYLKEPQPSSSRSQLFPGNKAEAGNTGYYRTSGAPLVQELKEFNNENPRLPVNGYMSSGLRGRSAICRMSRSPYFKVLLFTAHPHHPLSLSIVTFHTCSTCHIFGFVWCMNFLPVQLNDLLNCKIVEFVGTEFLFLC